jgi:UDP-glucose 4-epimerase
MNVAVTGGAGYIGSVVVEFAVAAGHNVTVIDNLQTGNRCAVPDTCRFLQADFGDPRALDEAFSGEPVDAVIHLAAETTIHTSLTDPGKYFLNNVAHGLALLEAMRRHDVSRLIFSSTAAIYGEPRTVPIPEDHPVQPLSAYGESKWMFERCLTWYSNAYGIRAVSLRYFNAGGATSERGEDRRDETHLVPLVLDAAMGRREAVDVCGTDYPTPDGTCIRDYVHVCDIARAHLAALERIDDLRLESFNIGSGSGFSVLEVIRAAEEVTGRRIARVVRPRRLGDPAVLVASPKRIHRMIGWEPEHSSLKTILGTAWRWRQRFPDGYAC